MGDGGVSMLLIREGVYPGPVNSSWNVPDGTPGCPVSMGRCVTSARSIIGGSTSIASVASRISMDSPPVSPSVAVGKTLPSRKPSPLQEHKVFAWRFLIRREVHRKMVITRMYLRVRCMSLT